MRKSAVDTHLLVCEWIDLCQYWNLHKFEFECQQKYKLNECFFQSLGSIGFNVSVYTYIYIYFFFTKLLFFQIVFVCGFSVPYFIGLIQLDFVSRWAFNLLTNVFYFVMAIPFIFPLVLRNGFEWCWCVHFITTKRQTFV